MRNLGFLGVKILGLLGSRFWEFWEVWGPEGASSEGSIEFGRCQLLGSGLAGVGYRGRGLVGVRA